ncbi:RDD family protein [Agaribacterium sp. ZY112]|uniref:RDD family protein n=1 Tax=Agaribacterium sp. ZY112 TaxID=3233574 RepID=UPI00352595F8
MSSTSPPKTTDYPPASLWKRLMATLYDSLILAAVSLLYFALATAVFSLLLGQEAKDFQPNAQGLSVQIGWGLSLFAFYCFFWLRVGQTVAMKAWRLKLVSTNNKPLSIARCALRALVAIVGLACLGLGWWWALIDPKKRCLHDIVSQSHILQLPKGS